MYIYIILIIIIIINIILYIYILKDIIKVSTGKWCHLAIQKLQKSMLPHGYVAWNPGIVSWYIWSTENEPLFLKH
jgi:hypothetical protein